MAISARRDFTPRPSISPLSTASKRLESSPNAADEQVRREMDDYEDAEMDSAIDPAEAEVGRQRDDHSSSLSEPEDDHAELDDEEEVDGIDEDTINGQNYLAQTSLEVDSEAETERLDQTPQKLRKHPDNLGRTPSKLSQTATADEELSEPPSPLHVGVDAASSTSTVATVGQKRKRSDTADSSLSSADSDIGESPRKRKHQLPLEEPIYEHATNADLEAVEPIAERAEDTPLADEPDETITKILKGPKGRKGKQKGKKAKEQVEDTPAIQIEEVAETVEEPAEEDPVKTEEQRKFKKEASTLYDDVLKQFRSFKEKLYNEKLATLDAELQLLSQPHCVHPEYIKQVASVQARMEKQMKEARAYYNYKLRSICERTLGERSQLHSQYFQHVRQVREDALYGLGEDWYAIQRERRQSHQDRDDAYVFKFPTKKSVQIRQQAKYNQEVSVLSGVAKYIGFPAAPEIGGPEGDSLEEDLRSMRISKRVTQSTAAPSRPVFLPGPGSTGFTQNERLAHEQYLEQNAWARPQASMQVHTTPGISHTPDWAEPTPAAHSGSSKQIMRNLSGQNPQRHASPFATPVPQQKHVLPTYEQPSSGAATFEEGEPPLPSSVVAQPPSTMERSGFRHYDAQNAGGSSLQTSPITFPRPRENGTAPSAAATDLPGFRNISGISGVSTIDVPEATEPSSSQEKASALPPVSLTTEQSTGGQQIFETSQIHRHPEGDKREIYASSRLIRPPEGAFGTPAPLQASPAVQGGART